MSPIPDLVDHVIMHSINIFKNAWSYLSKKIFSRLFNFPLLGLTKTKKSCGVLSVTKMAISKF